MKKSFQVDVKQIEQTLLGTPAVELPSVYISNVYSKQKYELKQMISKLIKLLTEKISAEQQQVKKTSGKDVTL